MRKTQEQQQYGVERLVAFCDAVFGFAITLLVVDVINAFPHLPSSATEEQLRDALLGLWPSFYSYALSFFLVGTYWAAHHRVFGSIINADATLVWLNLALLLCVAFLPFSTFLLDEYVNSTVIVAFYAATMTIISLFSLLVWEYAAFEHRLIPADLDQKTIRLFRWRGRIALAFFLVSIGLAFLSPWLAKGSWLAIFLIRPLLLRQFVEKGP
jgi:uncharacterized membrane protein